MKINGAELTPESPAIKRVGVVGCGTMGAGIAEICALADLEVVVAVSGKDAAERGSARVNRSLERGLLRGRLTEVSRDVARERLMFTTDMADLADMDLVVEAIRETQADKEDLFGKLDKIVGSTDAILASSTSSVPIIRLARATVRPEQVVGLHFFNPVQALPLVELVGSLLTAQRTVERAELFVVEVLGKQTIRTVDRAGFLVNALLIPYLLNAIRMVESSFATATEVDDGMTLGCSHPMGPLRLADFIGLDIVLSVAEALHAEFREPQYAPPTLLVRMVDAAMLGKKSGQGFYSY